MDSRELRQRFFNFFQERGHTIVPSSSLVPDDPSVLLTTAGMQQFKPYYTGAADPFVSPHPSLGGKPLGSKNAVSIQKSFRTSDIDEVGDERHLTFFEMMGNFSFGGYDKEEAILYAYDFIVKEIGLAISYVTVFEGKESIGVPKDEESKAIWKKLDPHIKVIEQGMDDVFWGPTGNSGPCGPTTEMYCKNAAGQDIEIWNIVFNQYVYEGSRGELDNGAPGKRLECLKTFGVDTGMGLERLAMVSQGKSNVFETDLFQPLIEFLLPIAEEKIKRIFADHIRAIAFLISDGVRPSNKEAGYVLRRLIRSMLVYDFLADNIFSAAAEKMLSKVVEMYQGFYQELNMHTLQEEFMKEKTKFSQTMKDGFKEFDKRYPSLLRLHDDLKEPDQLWQRVGGDAFDLYQTYGFPPEVLKKLLEQRLYTFDETEFRQTIEEKFKKHQEISRAGQERKFGGHGLLLDTGELKAANEEELEIVTRLHTATHLAQAALRKILGDTVHQAGSDITAERLRFDFTFDRKLMPEELKAVEDWVNIVIQRDVLMGYKEMPYEEAVKTGALYFEKEKYPPVVKVYSAADSVTGEVFSKELCGGPHVTHTGEVGHFKILKEESVGAGIRRLRAVVE